MNLDLTNILETTKLIQQIRGDLIELDFKVLGFEPRRIFIVNNVPNGDTRGKHAHYETFQCLLVTSGCVDIILDNGSSKIYTTLEKGQLLHQAPLQWLEMTFRNNASIMVISSTQHNEEDYIRDYSKFKKVVGISK